MGKTESAFLPIMHKLLEKKHEPISVLYITPLKSLNRDLLNRMFLWGDKTDIDISVRHGDTSKSERAAQTEHPSDIFIITPETLQAVIIGKRFREHLRNVKYVIIDEIHELVGSKRGIQLSLGLERLKELCGNFQKIGLSATVGSPEIVADFIGKDTEIIRADSEKNYQISVEYPVPGIMDKNSLKTCNR